MRAKKPSRLDGPELLDYALGTLASRSQSAGELRVKLHRRAATPSDADEVMKKLTDAGYIDDARFAEAYAQARRDNQGFGQIRVLRDLRARRVPGEIASRVVREAFEEVEEEELASRFLARKYRSMDLTRFLAEEKNLASAFRRLRVAGFSASASMRVLRRYSARAGELEDHGAESEDFRDG